MFQWFDGSCAVGPSSRTIAVRFRGPPRVFIHVAIAVISADNGASLNLSVLNLNRLGISSAGKPVAEAGDE